VPRDLVAKIRNYGIVTDERFDTPFRVEAQLVVGDVAPDPSKTATATRQSTFISPPCHVLPAASHFLT
jgi:hypothetical protein